MNEETHRKNKRLHAHVTGRVQGVNFRAYAQRTANDLRLTGWVRNRYDCSVETVAEGDEDALKQYLGFLRTGPPSAWVEEVREAWADSTGEFSDFNVRYF